MSIEVYVPTKLNSEINKYSDAKGNYNVDYRDNKNNGTTYYLDTPYDLLTSVNSTFKSLPLKVGDNHVSGNNKNYRSITRDFVFKNTGSSDTCLNVLSNTDTYYYAVYSSTTYMLSTNSFIHTFNMISVVPQGITLKPLMLKVSSESLLGYSTTKKVSQIDFTDNNYTTTIDYTNLKIIVKEDNIDRSAYSRTYRDGRTVELVDVKGEIKYLKCFTSKNNYQLNTKLKFITSISSTTNPILNSLYTNYTTYTDSSNPNATYPSGYSMLLKPNESVLLSEELYTPLDTQSTEVVFGTDSFLYGEFFTGNSSSYSNCLQIKLPSTVPTVNKEISDDQQGTVVTQVPAVFTLFIGTNKIEVPSVTNTTDLFKGLRRSLLKLGVYTHLLKNDTLAFIKDNNLSLSKVTIFYKNTAYTTVTNKDSLLNNSTNTTVVSQDYFLPVNQSFSVDKDTPINGDIYDDYFYYDCFSFKLDSNTSFTDSLANTIVYNVDITTLKANSKGTLTFYNNDSDTTINLYKDLSSTDSSSVLQTYCDYLNSVQSLGKFQVVKDKNQIYFTNNSGKIISSSFSQTAFTLDTSYQYLVSYVDNTYFYDLKSA